MSYYKVSLLVLADGTITTVTIPATSAVAACDAAQRRLPGTLASGADIVRA